MIFIGFAFQATTLSLSVLIYKCYELQIEIYKYKFFFLKVMFIYLNTRINICGKILEYHTIVFLTAISQEVTV